MTADAFRLDGKSAVVTGGGSGIGRAAAVEFARAGASLVLVGRNEEALHESARLAREAGADAHVVQADVSLSRDVSRYVDEAVSSLGTIDVLLNNAGIEGLVAPLAEYPEDDFDRIMAINVRGTFLGLRHVLPIMLEQGSGSVINMASIAAERGLPGTSAYNASKHAVLGLTRSAASEVAGAGVRVNAISAGVVDTRMLRSLADQFMPGELDAALGALAGANPTARLGTPEEIAFAIRFLASDAAAFVNGAAWAVDGGTLGTVGGSWT